MAENFPFPLSNYLALMVERLAISNFSLGATSALARNLSRWISGNDAGLMLSNVQGNYLDHALVTEPDIDRFRERPPINDKNYDDSILRRSDALSLHLPYGRLFPYHYRNLAARNYIEGKQDSLQSTRCRHRREGSDAMGTTV